MTRQTTLNLVRTLIVLIAAIGAVASSSLPVQAGFYDSTVLADGPVGYWRFEETSGTNAADSAPISGSQNGTYMGSPTLGQPGALVNQPSDVAVRFDPTVVADDFVQISGLPITQSFTIEWWARSANATHNENGWFGAERGANGFILHANDASTSWSGYIMDNAAAFHLIGTHNPGAVIDSWHHYAITYDAGLDDGIMYFDGVPAVVNTSVGATRDLADTITLLLGKDDTGNNRFGDGWLDEVALYDTVLTSTQLQLHYDIGVGNVVFDPNAVPEPSTAALAGLGLVALLVHRRRSLRPGVARR